MQKTTTIFFAVAFKANGQQPSLPPVKMPHASDIIVSHSHSLLSLLSYLFVEGSYQRWGMLLSNNHRGQQKGQQPFSQLIQGRAVAAKSAPCPCSLLHPERKKEIGVKVDAEGRRVFSGNELPGAEAQTVAAHRTDSPRPLIQDSPSGSMFGS